METTSELSFKCFYDPGHLQWAGRAQLCPGPPSTESGGWTTVTLKADSLSFNAVYPTDDLLPVTKYVSPNTKTLKILILERTPNVIRIGEYNVPVPWSYILVAKVVDKIKVCWLFRSDPNQLILSNEYLGASWMTRKSYTDCDNDLLKFIEANQILEANTSDVKVAISVACSTENLQKQFNPDNFGAQILAENYNVDPEHLFRDLHGKDLSFVVNQPNVDQLNIDQLHSYVVDLAIQEMPTLSEMLNDIASS